MPYDIERDHPKCGAGEMALVNAEDGTFYGCHTSRESAQDQIAVIEQNKQMDLSDLLVTPPINQIKDIDDKGTFGGYLINFGSKEEHDLERDFFNKETDFWLDITGNKSAVLFGHGADEHFGKKRLDKEGAILTVKDAGVWMETQLRKRNEYEEMVQKLAKQGKLGLSSGTASHLVERESAGTVDGKTVHHIKQWPLGLDATLTPTPAEPRLKVQPLSETEQKSIKTVAEEVLGKSQDVTQVMSSALDSTKASQEEIEERYEKFTNTVNMSASEIENWGENECADKASQNPTKVRERVIDLLSTNKEDWGDEEYEDAGKVISFINRMREVDGGEAPSEDCPSKRDISLMNWGYDPTKSALGSMSELLDDLNAKAQHDYSTGDLVAWNDGSAQGIIREIVGPDESVSPSTTDRSFSGNENEDGYLIELVDYDEEEDEIVGRDETVFHLGGTLESISKQDVSTKGEVVGDLLKTLDEVNEEFEHRNGASKSDEDSILSDINNTLDSINESIN